MRTTALVANIAHAILSLAMLFVAIFDISGIGGAVKITDLAAHEVINRELACQYNSQWCGAGFSGGMAAYISDDYMSFLGILSVLSFVIAALNLMILMRMRTTLADERIHRSS